VDSQLCQEEITKAKYKVALGSVGLGLAFVGSPAFADCSGLPNNTSLKAAVTKAIGDNNGGLAFNMWATLVSNDRTVCAVAVSGGAFTDQWLGSRVISAQSVENPARKPAARLGRESSFYLMR
jgi:hypothetical protein